MFIELKDKLTVLKEKLTTEITEIPEGLRGERFAGLDGLRGFSIIIVVLSHLYINTPYSPSIVGSIGVWTFFVISGFLITSLLLKEKVTKNKISLKSFYVRRFLRIIPVAYLFLIVLWILNLYLKLQIPSKSIITASLFLQNIPRLSPWSWYTYHYWSLSVEEQFYCTFPFLLVFNLNKYTATILILILLVPAIEFIGFSEPGGLFANKIIHAIIFIIINLLGKTVNILLGSLFAILLYKKVIVIKDTIFYRYLSLFLFIIAVLICTNSSIIFIPYAYLVLFPLLMACVIVLNLNPNSVLTRILSFKPLMFIGTISYSLYIWQQLFSHPDYWLINSKSVLIHVVAMLACATASYYLFEKQFLRLKRSFKRF